MPSKKEITGLHFGRLEVKADGTRKNGRRTVVCLCECGKETVVDPRDLLSGHTKSCGCYQKEAVAKSASSRGTHRAKGTPEYNSWLKMKSRCTNQRDRKFPDYGGRGISICEQWLNSFECFVSDMGKKPNPNDSLDRINVNGNYEPTNCRWASPLTQSRNKRNHRIVEYEGVEMPLSQACELSGLNYRTALWRINNGKHWMPLPTPPSVKEG